METQIKKTAKDFGFKPNFKSMDMEETKMFASIMFAKEENIKDFPEKEIPFPIAILRKRITGLNLPIKFTKRGEFAMLILTEGIPGKVVTFLIDSLTKFENDIVDIDNIAELYPWGFYDDKSFTDLIDNYIKPKKIKWSEIY